MAGERRLARKFDLCFQAVKKLKSERINVLVISTVDL